MILPNLRRRCAGASFLTLALVLGEFTVAPLLGYQPFAGVDRHDRPAAGPAVRRGLVLSLLVTWLLLLASVVGRCRSAGRSCDRTAARG